MPAARPSRAPSETMAAGESTYLVDTTLRDGEQAPGVSFSIAQQCEVAERLAAIGIGEIEAGTPAMGEEEVAAIRAIAKRQLPVRISAWCRATDADIDGAARSGADAAHLSFPTSDVHLGALGKPASWLESSALRVLQRACGRFDFVSVGAQDAFRAPVDRLVDVALAVKAAGAHRFRLADTVGVATPRSVGQLVRTVIEACPHIEVGFHGHNDLGLATANTLAAIEAGAACVDVTVGGLGERAGNAPLEQVVMAMEVAMERSTGIDTRGLAHLCERVASLAHRTISPSAPVVGSAVFSHESGIHVDGMLRDERTYEPFAAERVGRCGSRLVLGKHSGASALQHVLAERGIAMDRAAARQLLPLVRASAAAHHGVVPDDDLDRIIQQVGQSTCGAAL